MMREFLAVAAMLAGLAGPPAWAHAVLDHASPAVGSAVPTAPPALVLWFTQALEPAFCAVSVSSAAGERVDLGNLQLLPGHTDALQVGLKPLPPGTYRVVWHVLSVDTHPTEGSFTFTVGGG